MVCGDARGQPHRRRGCAGLRQRRPGLGGLGRLVLLGRPDLDEAGVPRAVARRGAIGSRAAVTPGVRSGSAKIRSTAASSGATERNDSVSGTRRQAQPGLLGARGERLARRGEHRGRGALEAVDRLLLVADGEQRARRLAGAGARRRTPRPARGSPATARGSCPAPRRPGCGRGRRRACRAPTRPRRDERSRLAVLATRSSKSSAARRALASP